MQPKFNTETEIMSYFASPPSGSVRVVMTPGIAAKLLLRNTGNRPLRERRAAELAGAMQRGEWQVNGDTIRFSETGRLLDGQHRLSAVASGTLAVPMDLVFNIPDDAQDTMDIGAARTHGDQLGIAGVKNATCCAAVAVLVHRYQLPKRMAQTRPSMAQVKSLLEQHPIERIVADVRKFSKSDSIIAGSIVSFVGVLTRKDYDRFLAFCERVQTGLHLSSSSDPIYVLRRHIAQRNEGRHKLTRDVICAYTVKAWNAWQADKPMKVLRWTSAESFPVIR